MNTKVKLEKWQIAQKRHRLSDKHIQMARELGLNPDKLGKIDNHKQETWKAPLSQFIEDIYFKRYKRTEPAEVKSINGLMVDIRASKEQKKKTKEQKLKETITQGYNFMIEIKSLAKTEFDTIFKAFNQAFADYEIQLNDEQLKAMMKRRGYCPELSFAAFDGNDIVAFTLNGIGYFNGISTAYDTGTGTLKAYRGKGLATKIFEHSIPHLKEANIGQYLLEVLQHNTKAVSVYRNLGFEVSREFYYFMQKNEEILHKPKTAHANFSIQQIDIEAFHSISGFWDFHPSWQNSFASIQRATGDFVCLGVFSEKELAGYCVFEPASGDITQIAVDKQHRRKGVATLLLHEMIEMNRNETIKVVNTDISCSSITDFLKAKNIEIKGKQFEMMRKI